MDELLNGRRRRARSTSGAPNAASFGGVRARSKSSSSRNEAEGKSRGPRPRGDREGVENLSAAASNVQRETCSKAAAKAPVIRTPTRSRADREAKRDAKTPRTAEARIEKTRQRQRQRLRRGVSEHIEQKPAAHLYWQDAGPDSGSISGEDSDDGSAAFGGEDGNLLARARFVERLRRLEQENAMLRENGRRWRRKLDQEKAVNKELGKRSKKWRAQCEALQERVQALEEKVRAQDALLERVSPVSTLASPNPWWATASSSMPALQTLNESHAETDEPPQSDTVEATQAPPAALSVEVEERASQRRATARAALLAQVIIVDDQERIAFCWPESARDQVPPNVEQFCFLRGSASAPECFVFMLSGECSTPLTRGFSCLDNATFGVCLSDGASCMCIISKQPFFRLFEDMLLAMREAGPESRNALLQDMVDGVASMDLASIGPGACLQSSNARLSWTWPSQCATRMDLFVDWGLSILLEALPLDQVFFLVGCMLLELKIVLVSSDLRRVTAAAFALLPFLRPCAWVQPFIPLLPPSLSVVCDAPVPVLVGAAEVPSAMQDSEAPSSPYRDNGRQEAVVVRLDAGRLDLSEALSTSYHALKLPGLTELCLETRDVEDPSVLLKTVQDHLSGLLRACHFFGRSVGNPAVTSSLPSPHVAIEEADQTLTGFVPLLKRNLAISPPWQFLARLQTTQLFMQWCETEACSLHDA